MFPPELIQDDLQQAELQWRQDLSNDLDDRLAEFEVDEL